MLTALIVAVTVTALVLATLIVIAALGWFPRLAALTARGLALLFWRGEKTRLDRRDRAELAARLWVPWLAL